MKKSLLLVASIMSLSMLVGCSAKKTTNNQIQELLNKSYGTQSATTHVVKVLYNLASSSTSYDVIYVEGGSSIYSTLGKEYTLSLEGRTFVGLSNDKYGASLYSQTSIVNSDLTLYAYTIPSSKEGVDTPYEYQEETKTYSITWTNAPGSSYVLKDGGGLPVSANSGETISFYVNYDKIGGEPSVFKNGTRLIKSEGYYTITITGNTTITVDNCNVTTSQANPYSKVYLMCGANSWKMNKDYAFKMNLSPSYSDMEYFITDVQLSAGDAFKVYDFNADSWLGASCSESGVLIANDASDNFVAIVDGYYDIYLKYKEGVASIYISCSSSELSEKTLAKASDSLIETGYDYHLWTWGSSSTPLGYVTASLVGTTLVFELPSGCSGFLVGKFEKGASVPDGSTTWISCVSQSNDVTLVDGTSLYTISTKL